MKKYMFLFLVLSIGSVIGGDEPDNQSESDNTQVAIIETTDNSLQPQTAESQPVEEEDSILNLLERLDKITMVMENTKIVANAIKPQSKRVTVAGRCTVDPKFRKNKKELCDTIGCDKRLPCIRILLTELDALVQLLRILVSGVLMPAAQTFSTKKKDFTPPVETLSKRLAAIEKVLDSVLKALKVEKQRVEVYDPKQGKYVTKYLEIFMPSEEEVTEAELAPDNDAPPAPTETSSSETPNEKPEQQSEQSSESKTEPQPEPKAEQQSQPETAPQEPAKTSAVDPAQTTAMAYKVLQFEPNVSEATILGLSEGDAKDVKAIEKARRKKLLTWHPDKQNVGTAKERYKELNISDADRGAIATAIGQIINTAHDNLVSKAKAT